MPAVVLYRRLQPWGISIPYLLDDEFTDIKAAGAFLGTPAVPGPGDRQGVDTNLIMSTAGGGPFPPPTCPRTNPRTPRPPGRPWARLPCRGRETARALTPISS